MAPPLTRSATKKQTQEIAILGNKRILETSLSGKPTSKKRAVFCDLTNVKKSNDKKNSITVAKLKKAGSDEKLKMKEIEALHILDNVKKEIPSPEADVSTGSAYVTAEDSFANDTSLGLSETKDYSLMSCQEADEEEQEEPIPNVDPRTDLPPGVHDYDLDNWRDTYSVSAYTMDIFQYLKDREVKFTVKKYMDQQPHLTRKMRAVLVDWLVEVQESYEINHESLYLAVKLVDMFLTRTANLQKNLLQLVGVTAIFIACKCDERCPPAVDDFLYICDDAYNKKQVVAMEKKILQTLKYELGAPLSYTFQRRYARCANLGMATLTLARYILETCLMEYELVDVRDSKLAAASLYLALQMQQISGWTSLLQYYSSYEENDLVNLAKQINLIMHESRKSRLSVIRTKYSNEAFFKVSTIPLLKCDEGKTNEDKSDEENECDL